MNGWSGRSTLRNLNPWSAGAGLMVSVTFCPVCNDVPSSEAEAAIVCCISVGMAK